MDILRDTSIDWLKYRWWFAGVSLAVFVAGAVDTVAQGGIRYGIDFSEGTLVVAKFTEPPEIEAVRDAVSGLGYGNAVIQRYDAPELNQVMIRIEKEPEVEGAAPAESAGGIDAGKYNY